MTIYTLSDPRTDLVFYVGASKNLKTRKHGKYSAPTYKELRSLGLKPVMEPVDECEPEDRALMESYWVRQFIAWGFPIENKGYNSKHFLNTKVNRLKYAINPAKPALHERTIGKLQHMLEIMKSPASNEDLVNITIEAISKVYMAVYAKSYAISGSPKGKKNRKMKNISPLNEAA